ncbi:MAG: nucleoside phosphorylase [Lachnospiraceae bacterium]|nr:nucleoside phosphorylase [Lachnospiraceae bacterium]
MDEWKNAARPVDEKGKQYHIRCGKGEVARYCLLPGDPKRVSKIAQTWDCGEMVADYREHVTYTGKIGDLDISACSTGAGGGSTASALEDLAELGCDTLIRVGTCGTIQEWIKPGDLIICSGAVRKEGTSDGYVINSYPAIANYEITLALIQAAEHLGYPYHVGIGYTAGSFFCGQGRPGYKGYSQSFMNDILPDMKAAGVLNFEMEAATVLTISSLYGMRAGAIFTVVANRVNNSFQYDNSTVDHNIEVANLAMQILWDWEKKKQKTGKAYFFPSLLNG